MTNVASDKWRIESFDPSRPWPHEGEYISLLTPEEFARLPNGVTVISIFGKEYVKGRDYIDDETRGGRLAFGVQDE
jgi:hypothetical protein